jgi:hypothetical protein
VVEAAISLAPLENHPMKKPTVAAVEPTHASPEGEWNATSAKPSRQRRMAREAGGLSKAADAPVARERRGPSKIDQVVTLLKREGGATLAEMIEATGWLPHTTRAALTGLRKKGQAIGKTSRDGTTVYAIAEAA